MIARTWRATATPEKAATYHRHFVTKVIPHLRTIAGYQGASLLRRETDGDVEFLAVTLWDSVDSIRAFAGPDPTRAVVEPTAQALLTKFDLIVHNYEVSYTDDRGHGGGPHP
jgi:heme-degrading monooxygenase HmoA